MIGAIIGDMVGSTYEFHPTKSVDFELVPAASDYTDDSLMTIAQGMAFTDWFALDAADRSDERLNTLLVARMQELGRRFPNPMGAYGGRFSWWLQTEHPEPYNSWGNGSAMRASAAGELATTGTEAMHYAKLSAEVTHNHPEGIKGAQATAFAIYLARLGESKEAIGAHISNFFYPLNRTLDEIRPGYGFDESCAGTVPESIQAFLEADSFEQAIRNAVSLGGDADTMGAITGSIAWAYFATQQGVDDTMRELEQMALAKLPNDLREFVVEYERRIQ